MERSRTEAAKYWEKACDVKHDRACHMLSEMYHYGVGVTKDLKRAKQIRISSCDRGHAESCHALGVAYLTGSDETSSRDPSKALEPLSRACERGHGGACHNVGSLTQSFILSTLPYVRHFFFSCIDLISPFVFFVACRDVSKR